MRAGRHDDCVCVHVYVGLGEVCGWSGDMGWCECECVWVGGGAALVPYVCVCMFVCLRTVVLACECACVCDWCVSASLRTVSVRRAELR